LMVFYNRYDESGRVKEISYFARRNSSAV